MPIFLKFEGIEGEHTQGELKQAFLKIDADFLKLGNANPDALLNVHGHIKHDINAIGDSFLKLGDDFLKLSDVALKIDEFVIKLNPPNPTLGSVVVGDGGGAPSAQADFIKLDTTLKTSAGDLGVLGTDFLKLDTALKLNDLKAGELVVSHDFLKLNADMTDAGGTFLKLGDDLIKLSTGPNPELDGALKLLGGELHKISSAFDAVAADFLKLGQDFATSGGGPQTTLAAAATQPGPTGPLGSDFLKLDQDFLLLNQTIGGAFPGTAKVLDALIDQSGKPPGDRGIDDAPPLLGGHGGSGH